ncbi:MAG: RagB/SusD family nutrient uptake outer membrane protein [Pedobacter sp.]|nr:MAG: RagB/SusD family nutrient uptake outer membrane protein [Pedobacter sp.]
MIWKWLGTGVVNPANINVPPSVRAPYESDALFRMFRVADTWLLRGEVLNRLNRKVEAIAHLNNMRGRAGRPNSLVTVASTTDEIEDAILQERGLELGFEGYRWYDLMRMANHRNSPKVLIDAVKRRAPVAMHTYLEGWLSNTAHWYLPYNANEIRLNPNLKPKG